jgi:hypothetical protein
MPNYVIIDGPGIWRLQQCMFDPIPFKGAVGGHLHRDAELTVRYETWPHGLNGCITMRAEKILVVITGIMWRTRRFEHMNIIGSVVDGPTDVIKPYFWALYSPRLINGVKGEMFFSDNEHTFQEA